MSSVKCPQCGLVLWATAQSCKRCGASASSVYDQSSSQPYHQPGPPDSMGSEQNNYLLGITTSWTKKYHDIVDSLIEQRYHDIVDTFLKSQ